VAEDDKVVIWWGSRRKLLRSDLSIDELVAEVEALAKPKTSAILDLIIGTAYANPVAMVAGAVVGVGALVAWGVEEMKRFRPLRQIAETLHLVCKNSKSLSLEELVESFNTISDLIQRECPRIEIADLCVSMNATQRSYQSKVSTASATNNQDRNSIKDVEFNGGQKRYRVIPRASAQ
jgi:hypothetical protein